MRLDLLLEREPFPEVFSETLKAYLQHRFGWQGDVRWCSGRNGRQADFLVNDKLNLIFPSGMAVEQLRTLAAEYAYHPNQLRRILQELYVRYAVTRPWRWYLASADVYMDPWLEDFSSCVILGGNHSVRIIDLGRDCCVVVRKIGFRQEFLDAAIDLRVRYSDLPGPQLLEWDSTEGWYEEELIRGLPLNRVANAGHVELTLMAARQWMASLYERTAEEATLKDWVEYRQTRISEAVAQLPPVYDWPVKRRILAVADQLTMQLHNSGMSAALLPISTTHGDFQSANILMPDVGAGSPVYLIDWEYSAVRCRWYDALVFDLSSRFPMGLAQRLASWANDERRREKTLNWCGCQSLEQWAVHDLLAIFLLDDLLLRLRENAIPGLRQQSNDLRVFLDELSALRWLT